MSECGADRGIHRAGEVYGILQTCINHTSMDTLAQDDVHHAGVATNSNPECRAVDVDIIGSFDGGRIAP